MSCLGAAVITGPCTRCGDADPVGLVRPSGRSTRLEAVADAGGLALRVDDHHVGDVNGASWVMMPPVLAPR